MAAKPKQNRISAPEKCANHGNNYSPVCASVSSHLAKSISNRNLPSAKLVPRTSYLFDIESHRRLKNRLILKAILCMLVLLVLTTLVLVTCSKFQSFSNLFRSNDSQITVIWPIRNVPLSYDLDTVNCANERSVLQDVRTEFVPPLPVGLCGSSPRAKRDTTEEKAPSLDNRWIRQDVSNETKSIEMESLEKLVWTQVSEKTKRNVALQIKTNSSESFWTSNGDPESIRQAQAEKMASFMDTSADPCQDFYQYACGRWSLHNPIPDDRAGFDIFEIVRDSLDSVLRDLLMEDVASEPYEAVAKAKMLFRSCMNEETLEERGNKPLIDLLQSLGGWPMLEPNWNGTGFNWIELSAKLRLYNNDILMMEWVGPDFRDSSTYIIQFDQTNLGLPTREYFLQPQNSIYLDAYKIYMLRVAMLLGADPIKAAQDAEELIAFETTLAKISAPLEERRNVSRMYEKLTLGQMEEQFPGVNWRHYLEITLSRTPEPTEPIVLFARKYYQQLVPLLNSTPPRIVASYLLWRFIKNRVNNLDSKFQEAKQEFYHVLFGREKVPSRWSHCVTHVNTNMGMAVGSLFVRRYFDENSKRDTVQMTQTIMNTFEGMLDDISWIDEETRNLAKAKVRAMALRIGYPDFILDSEQLKELYKNVTIVDTEYFQNTLNLLKVVAATDQARLGTAVNKTMWNTPPAVVNAYYSRNKNQIMFPAGILQPPFYHRHFPRSLNYGGIGVVIGHEVTHGFDDKGRLFDLDGNLHRWWKEEAIEGFRQRAQCLVDQYNAYTVQEVEMRINGLNTQGENIADNGGVKQSFRAYEKWISENGDIGETLPGINATHFQLFFLNFAQVWCGAMRPEASRNKLQTAVHSPGRFRVIGTLSNSIEFSRVYNCPLASTMNPQEKCSVW